MPIPDSPKRDRRRFLLQCAATGLAATTVTKFGTAAEGPAPALIARAASTPRLVIDALGGISNPNLPDDVQEGAEQGIDARSIADAKAAGLCAVNQTLGYVFGPATLAEQVAQTDRELTTWDALIAKHANSLLKVLGGKHILQAQATKKIGVIYGFQNASMLGPDATRVAYYRDRGVRVIQLTYNNRNQLGDGAMVAENRGLSDFGREVVHALNKNRLLVDLSHSGENTCLDAIATSARPIILSHTGCRAVADLPRNKSDKELRLVADKGGFVGIYFMPFLAIGRQPLAADLIAHIEHAIKTCGEDHVGLGTDGTVSPIDDMPKYLAHLKKEVADRRAKGISATGERDDIVPFLPDLSGKDKFTRLAELLAQRGHSSARIDKILGGNFLRVANEIW